MGFDVPEVVWSQCQRQLRNELPEQQYNTWIRPLVVRADSALNGVVQLLAPNRFIEEWVKSKFLARIQDLFGEQGWSGVSLIVSCSEPRPPGFSRGAAGQVPQILTPQVAPEAFQQQPAFNGSPGRVISNVPAPLTTLKSAAESSLKTNLNKNFTFDSFVEGKSNQLAFAAAQQVAENPGGSYNPLFIYGGVGLGKTHLMHAVGNAMRERKPDAKIVYLHSERFVADMVKALQLKAIDEFKSFYRSVDALLIDDIQFFSGKERSQEEFFHTYNALLEGGQQMILTCDRYPKEIDGVEERLKAEQAGMALSKDAAFFIAQRIRSNVRELEGALKRVLAHAQFTGRAIDIDLIRESLKDLLALQDKLVTIDNIQRVVADYYKLKMSDMLSKRRSRSIARPRQVAMSIAKELTNHSLPEIGESFGGRDHTTVLHACRKVKELESIDREVQRDLKNLYRTLSS